MTGKLIGIARAKKLKGPMEELDEAIISVSNGFESDARGTKPGRQITILFALSWKTACSELGSDLPWTTRRANLFVDGITPPQEVGARLAIGNVILEITQETEPCFMMDQAKQGLREALTPDWRGGICCNVIEGGRITIGDTAAVLT